MVRNRRDPTDHRRTTCPHAGEMMIDNYHWPGLLSIAIGVISLVACVTAAAYGRHEFIPTTGIVGVLAVAGGVGWLVLEHRRVLQLERIWLTEHSGDQQSVAPLRALTAIYRPEAPADQAADDAR